jgi:hypothetical protein
MTEQDKPRFLEILFGLAELLGGKLSDAGIEMYFRVLSRFSIEQVEIAADRMLTSSQRFPVPAQFIEAIEGKQQDRAEKAWDLFVEAVRRGGAYKSLYAPDGALVAAISKTQCSPRKKKRFWRATTAHRTITAIGAIWLGFQKPAIGTSRFFCLKRKKRSLHKSSASRTG